MNPDKIVGFPTRNDARNHCGFAWQLQLAAFTTRMALRKRIHTGNWLEISTFDTITSTHQPSSCKRAMARCKMADLTTYLLDFPWNAFSTHRQPIRATSWSDRPDPSCRNRLYMPRSMPRIWHLLGLPIASEQVHRTRNNFQETKPLKVFACNIKVPHVSKVDVHTTYIVNNMYVQTNMHHTVLKSLLGFPCILMSM